MTELRMSTSPEDVVEMSCRFCDGRGLDPSGGFNDSKEVTAWSRADCRICKGLTLLRLHIPDTPVNCPTCQGTGRGYMATPLTPPTHRLGYPNNDACHGCEKCYGLGIRPMSGVIKVKREYKMEYAHNLLKR